MQSNCPDKVSRRWQDKLPANPDFWRGKRVLITGHTGFKGSWLALWLQHLGAEVTGYALAPPTQPSLFEVARVGSGMHSVTGNVCDASALMNHLQDVRPDVVFHLAAQALVRYGYQAPVETYATNVMGTVHLLEAVRHTKSVRAVVNVTSDKCYENKEWPWGYRENEPMGGYDPYSNSKGCSELVTAAYRNSFFNPARYQEHQVAIASARAGNVIGGGDWAPDRLMPDAIRAIETGIPVNIRSPKAVRPWQHVLEPLSGYLRLAEKLVAEGSGFSEGWNFGPADEDMRSVEWVMDIFCRCWGKTACWQADSAPQPHEALCLKLDSSKAVQGLGWHSRWSLPQALERVADWHKARQNGADMRAVTLEQILRYESTEC